ncbi:hypothetical protein AQUCO_00201079v1 [Aquilegia coerulea]|uniref:BED-type domain-containing protein n=1 Tax=Aquilegia coerulea TaxID=218851 RepID=A0A2G5F661_AQUCA|nr:hypothetical protein AQUCO_00201079v1 [Aquilegia coerulea]
MNFEASNGKSGQMVEWNANAFKSLKDMEPKSTMESISTIDPTVIALASEAIQKGTTVAAVKPRKKTMTSLYLRYFETAPDGKTRSCKFCKQSYSIATATGNLGRHLSHRHPGYDKVSDVITNGNPAQQPTTVIKKHQSPARPVSVDLDHLNWLLLKWLIGASHPPGTLEEEGLANSFKFANSLVKIWSTERFQAVILEVYKSMREDVRTSLEQVKSKISITLDFWTSYEQVFYMSVTGHWIDENWILHKVLLDICHIPYPCGGADIYHMLLKVLKMYNIENRILCCTHDNSQNAFQACHTLNKEDLDGRKTGSLCYIPCAARTLNLIIEDGLRTAKPVISKIREFALVMNTSAEISEDFRQITAAYQEGSWKFPIDASNRWSGSYTMLDIMRKASKSIDAVIRKHAETLASRNVLLSPPERNAVNIMHNYLEPFYKTTNNICTSKVLTIGLVLFFMDHVVEMINSCRDSRQSPDWLKSAADDMSKTARTYNSQVYNLYTYMAAILDPRIKSELVPENLNSESNLEDARSHFLRNYSSSHFPAMANGYTVQENEDGGSLSFAEEIARKRRRISMNTTTDELTQYLSESPAPFTTDVLEWWKGNTTRYPRLSVMARDFLAMQATSVSPEQLFCGKGDEIDKQRICLPHASMQAILCTRSWTDSGFKVRYRSTEIDYERLMESASAVTDNGTLHSEDKAK